MQIIRGLCNITKTFNGCVATIGNFDGVHLGHQQLLTQTFEQAQRLKLPSVVVTFEPYPSEYFNPHEPPARLTRLREKVLAIQNYAPIDYLLCLHFNASLANLSPSQFILTLLVEKLAVKYLITGDDFRFGYQRQGDITLLTTLGQQYDFEVKQHPALLLNSQRVSSTQIRTYLAQGNLAQARALLGRNYSLCGQVVRGDQRGRLLGFPTANIFLKRKVVPLAGVFAVKIHGAANKPLLGVANIGTRPTVDGTRSLLEVYLFDFDQTIYGLHLNVEFIAKIRPEYKFSSLEALKAQIANDVKQARQVLGLLC